MRILIIGGGGREHALAWKIAQSPRVEGLFAAPGNPGIARHAACVPLAADALDGLVAFAKRERIDLAVAGPEAPLVAGLAGRFIEAGLADGLRQQLRNRLLLLAYIARREGQIDAQGRPIRLQRLLRIEIDRE